KRARVAFRPAASFLQVFTDNQITNNSFSRGLRAAPMTRNIIDVSHWEDPIDFKAAAADGIVAVITKATQGAAGVDSAYAKFRKAAAPYKFLWGSYHFGTGSEVDVQIEHYLNTVKQKDHDHVYLYFESNT